LNLTSRKNKKGDKESMEKEKKEGEAHIMDLVNTMSKEFEEETRFEVDLDFQKLIQQQVQHLFEEFLICETVYTRVSQKKIQKRKKSKSQ
jgi:hypothetical protein